MSSEQVIDQLVSGLAPVRPMRARRDALLLAGLCLAEIVLFVALGQARPDIGTAMALPSFWWKVASMGALTVVGVATALQSFRPGGTPRKGLLAFFAITAVALVFGWGIDAMGTSPAALGDRLMWRHGIACLFAMVILSIPPIVALALLMRRGAPTDRKTSALATGLAAAAWGAFVFVLNCPHDDPLYIAVWYVVGCGLIALAGRLILPRVARW